MCAWRVTRLLDGSAFASMAARVPVNNSGNLAALVDCVARGDGILDAMCCMIRKNLLLGATQGGTHRRKLGHDIDAIAVVFNHARKTAHLTLDPPQPFEHGTLGNRLHAAYIPLPGTR